MAINKKEDRHNPLANANCVSKIFVCWLTPLLHLGQKRRLEESDMYSVLPEDRSETVGEELQRFWNHEVKKASKELRKPRLTRVLIRCYGKSYAWAGLFAFMLESMAIFQPLLLENIIQYFENYDPDDQRSLGFVYGCAAALCISAFATNIFQQIYFYIARRTGMKMRVALCHVIYRKALCLSSESIGRTTTGQIVNFLSNDVVLFDRVLLDLHYLWLGPLQAIVVIVLLWYVVGPSCLAGVAVLALMMLLQTYFGKFFGILREKTAELTDDRIRMMNEMVSGIRIVKMYAWEKPISALVSEVRRKEISKILKCCYLRGLNMASSFASIKIISFVTFAVYILLGNTFTASIAFATISLYSVIKRTVALCFPLAIESLSETLVSIRRFKNFFLLEELERRNFEVPLEETKENFIEIEKLTCYWDKSLDAPSLQDISITVKSNQLLTVIGPVGSGKSSLLSAILGELPHDTGTLKVHGQLTYAAQQPWVFPGTIRSNILFGKELNPQKYERVIIACALKKDMDLLPDGDLTLIGDRGATLSGGQKARVNLARAVYQDADIYLLDDPLSAVDAEVGKHLFEQCICGLLKNKPRILVTHQLQHLKAADQIVVLKEGHIMAQGTHSELQGSGLDLVTLVRTDDEQDRWSRSADSDRRSLHSQKTHHSNSSHCSLLPSESNCTDQLPVSTFSK